MKKTELRNKLFDKYFENNDGILATELLERLSFISDTRKHLHKLCLKNIKQFHPFSKLFKIGIFEINKSNYMILQMGNGMYTIINLNTGQNISKEELRDNFDEDFFINNFNDVKLDYDMPFYELYFIHKYNGDINELVSYYNENKDVLSLTTELTYRFNIDETFTYFYIDFANARAQLSFETKDQYLYEQLFLNYDLTPANWQDAHAKIGVDRMKEMFKEIKNIKLPKEVIPIDLLEEYLKSTSKKQKENNYSLVKKKFN